MLHQYEQLRFGSASARLRDRMEQDRRESLKWAKENQNSCITGKKANAFYIFYTHYSQGYGGLPRDHVLARKYLKESAALGHGQAIYDFTMQILFSPEEEQAKQYINQALQQNKLNDSSFDFNDYKQHHMKGKLEGTLSTLENLSSLPALPEHCITNKGNMTVIGNGIRSVFDDVDFYNLDLKGNIPLSPRTKAFLESKGNKVTQDNRKITFHGDFFNTFSRWDVVEFLSNRPKLSL